MYGQSVEFSVLKGVTLSEIENKGDELIFHEQNNGRVWKMYHGQDCCESVTIEDIAGSLDDLIGAPIIGYQRLKALSRFAGMDRVTVTILKVSILN